MILTFDLRLIPFAVKNSFKLILSCVRKDFYSKQVRYQRRFLLLLYESWCFVVMVRVVVEHPKCS